MDFRSLRRIPVVDVCRYLGISLRQRNGQWRGACKICNHPSPRAFVVTERLNRFWCHGRCKSGGDALQLMMQMRGINHVEAAKLLVSHFGGRI